MDLLRLFDDNYYNLHYSNSSGRYFIQFFLSVKIQSTYDYLWDISNLEEKVDDFIQKYRSTRFSETISICLSDPYKNAGLIKLWDLKIHFKNLSDIVARYHELEGEEIFDPLPVSAPVIRFEEFIQSLPQD